MGVWERLASIAGAQSKPWRFAVQHSCDPPGEVDWVQVAEPTRKLNSDWAYRCPECDTLWERVR
jgi:hypothetical protein